MGNESRLEVVVTAAAGQFHAAMQGVEKRAQEVTGALSRVADEVAAGFTAERIIAFTREIAESAEQTKLLAERMGATFQGIQELGYVAERTGWKAEGLNKAFIAQEKALAGSGEQFRKLGLDQQALAAMKSDEAMLKIARALGDVENASKRVALAQEIFGKEGARVGQVMGQNKDRFAELADEAKTMGVAMDEATQVKWERTNDAFEKIDAAMKGYAQTLLVILGPAIEWVAEKAENAAATVKAISDREFTGKHYASGVAEQRWTNGESDRRDAWGAYYRTQNNLNDQMMGGGISKEKFGREIGDAISTRNMAVWGDFNDRMIQIVESASKAAAEAADKLKEKYGLPDFEKERGKLQGQLDLGNIDQGVYDRALTALNKQDPMWQAMDKLISSLREGAEKRAKEIDDEVARIKEKMRDPAEVLADTLTNLSRLQGTGKLDKETADRAGTQARADYENALKAQPMFKAIDSFMKSVQDGMEARAKQADEEVARIKEKMRDPAEVLADTLTNLSRLQGTGKLDKETADRAGTQARVDYENALKEQPMFKAIDSFMKAVQQGMEERAKQADADAERIKKSVQAPAEKYMEEMQRISELNQGGQLDNTMANRAANKAGSDYWQASGGEASGEAAAKAAQENAQNMQDAAAADAKKKADDLLRSFGTGGDVRGMVAGKALAGSQVAETPQLRKMDRGNALLEGIERNTRQQALTWQ